MKTHVGQLATPVGSLIIKATPHAIVEISFQKAPRISDENRWIRQVKRQLTEYFGGKRKAFDLPLEPQGTLFQRLVWKGLMKISFGRVCTYKELAKRIGSPRAFRAVGNALGSNPLAIVVPCHRVVSHNGLGGFSSGIRKKRFLLQLEGMI